MPAKHYSRLSVPLTGQFEKDNTEQVVPGSY